MPAGGYYTLIQGNGGNEWFTLVTNGFASRQMNLTLGGVPRTVTDNLYASRIGVWMLVVATYDSDRVRIYTDGVLDVTSAALGGAITNWNAGTGKVAFYTAATYGFDGNLRAPFVLSRCWSDAEVAQFYNATAKQACYKSDYGALVSLADEGGVLNQPISNTEWRAGDTVGRWRVETDTINGRSTKVLTCKVAGWAYLDLMTISQSGGAGAFGEWEFMIRRASASPCGLTLFANVVGTWGTAGMDGWSFDQYGPTNWEFVRTVAGAQTLRGWGLGTTANEWQTFKVARTVAGVWTCYRNSEVLSVAGGGGANPVTDTATLTGRYMTFYAGVGDKLAWGAADGSNALVKRPKAVA
jgi:hypothetical protein